MYTTFLWQFLIIALFGCKTEKCKAQAEVTYVAAVIEYEPYNQWRDDQKGFGVIRTNALKINDYANQAKNQFADIMVAPEYGLQSLNMYPEDFDKFLTYTQYVPNPEDNLIPYSMNTNNTNFEGIQILSRTAMENAMYLVVDLGEVYPCSIETVPLAPWSVNTDVNCPENGYYFYNTQVVFDRNGRVIARYRKQNLYGEEYYTPGPKNDDTALFLTDFNVLFTLQICFDIEFEHPGYNNVRTLGIKDVAMSTAWVDALPYDLADNSQNSWSRGLGVNLLVSGYHKPEKAKLGSGIFKGYSNDSPVYTYNKDSGNVLLVSEVRTIAAPSKTSRVSMKQEIFNNLNRLEGIKTPTKTRASFNSEKRIQHIFYSDLSNYTKVTLEKSQPGKYLNTYACSFNQLCCNLTYQYSGNLTYMFLVYSGEFITTSEIPVGLQICSVVWCKNEDYKSCAKVQTGLPDDDNFGPFLIFSSSFIMDSIYPGGNHRDLSIISNDLLKYDVSGKNFTLSTDQPISNHLMAALYGKWYS